LRRYPWHVAFPPVPTSWFYAARALYPLVYTLLFFFFKSYGPHRNLHSFPTRRSSDLGPVAVRLRVGDDLVLVEDRAHDLLRGREDRKSTRLNSSHVKISYAVFCLKKKKAPRLAGPEARGPPDAVHLHARGCRSLTATT